MSLFLTSKENIAVNLIFAWLGEPRCDRTYDDYLRIAERFPKLAACHAYVNQRLRQMAKAGFIPYEICYFRAGDQSIWFEHFQPLQRLLRNYDLTLRVALCAPVAFPVGAPCGGMILSWVAAA